MAHGGKRVGSGRKAGTQNKLTRSIKEAFEATFAELQGQSGVSLEDWAKANPTEFYKLSARLMPAAVELSGNQKQPVRFVIES